MSDAEAKAAAESSEATKEAEEPAGGSAPAAVAPPPEPGPTPIETAPCFCCGSRLGVPVGWTYWGYFAPKLLHHVKCVDCPSSYDARTGASNGPKILVLHLLYFLAGVAIAVTAVVLARS